MQRGQLVVVGIVLAGVVLAVTASLLKPDGAPRSVVLITVDTLRADHVGPWGRTPSLTPRMDALAEEGAVFTQCWTTAPLTVPAHASVLTGLRPPLHGLRTNDSGHRLATRGDRPFATVAEALSGSGRATAAFVSAGVLRKERTGFDAGFDVYDQVPPPQPGRLFDSERIAEETVTKALAWLKEQEGSVFLWVHLFDPHGPYQAPPPYGAGPSHVTSRKGYEGEVAYVDHWVGRLLDGVAASGREDAAVVLTADHGEGLGEHGEVTHGWLLHEATLHVPLIVRAPQLVPPGTVVDRPVSVVDVPRTLLALANAEIPVSMGGEVLVGKTAGRAPSAPYAETLYGYTSHRWAPLFASRVGDEKIVISGPVVRLYDLASDPRETAPRTAPVNGLDGRAAEWLDPLLDLAGRTPLGTPDTSSEGGAVPGYIGGSTDDGPAALADRTANAARRDPYASMTVLALLDQGRSLLHSGAKDEAYGVLARALEQDPDNPQAARWLARAVRSSAAPDFERAVELFERAFENGWRSPDCVSEVARTVLLSWPSVDRTLLVRALRFFETARGRGVRDTGFTLAWEAFVLHAAGRPDDARASLARAREMPSEPRLPEFLEKVSEVLR